MLNETTSSKMTVEYRDSNEYEVSIGREQDIDPHERVGGVPDDRMNTEPEFEVDDEFSCTNTDFGEFREDEL